MTRPLSVSYVRKHLGEPKKIDGDLRAFQNAARMLSARRPRLIEAYQKQWIAVHEGRVRAAAQDFWSLQDEIKRKRLPRQRIIVRFIDEHRRTMILASSR